MESDAFLRLGSKHEEHCLLCSEIIKRNEKIQTLGSNGWEAMESS